MHSLIATISIGLTLAASLAWAVDRPTPRQPSLWGDFVLPPGAQIGDVPVGGLSAIDYDPATDRLWLISDDRAERGPARAYEARLTFAAEGGVDVEVLRQLPLTDEQGVPFAAGQVDPEGLRCLPGGGLAWSSEGNTRRGIPPAVFIADAAGQTLRRLRIPKAFLPAKDHGVRNNYGFESLTLSPDGQTLWTASEAALVQDGPLAGPEVRSACRLLAFDLATGQAGAQYVYLTEPVVDTPEPEGALAMNSLSDLLALDDGTFLALERAFTMGVGFRIRLFRIDTSHATDVREKARLDATEIPVSKTLIMDLESIGRRLDNLEGLCFGPLLPDGRRSLILVSDNNFNAIQISQFLVFALDE